MSDTRRIQVLVKASTPEYYDAVTHAIVGLDLPLVDFLSRQMWQAQKLTRIDSDFQELVFGHCGAEFIVFGGPDLIDWREDDFAAMDDGSIILPANFEVTANHLLKGEENALPSWWKNLAANVRFVDLKTGLSYTIFIIVIPLKKSLQLARWREVLSGRGCWLKPKNVHFCVPYVIANSMLGCFH